MRIYSKIKIIFLNLILLFLTNKVGAQVNDFGYPFIKSYFSLSHTVQTFAIEDIAFTKEGFVFAVSNDGLVFYDGNTWHKILDGSFLSIGYDSLKNRIYLGTKDGFGFLEFDEASGKFIYNNLSKAVPGPVSSVWYIVITPNGPYFFTSKGNVYYYDQDSIIKIQTFGKFKPLRGVYTNKVLFAFDDSNGIAIVLNNRLLEYSVFHKNIYRQSIRTFLPGKHNGQYYVFTRTGKMYKYFTVEDKFVRIRGSASQLLESSLVENAIKVNDSVFAVGTLNKGLFIVDNHCNLIYHIDRNTGLSSNTVVNLRLGPGGSIWIASPKFISVVYYSMPFRYLGRFVGIRGELSNYFRFAGKSFVMSTNGLFYRDLHDSDLEFKQLTGNYYFTVASVVKYNGKVIMPSLNYLLLMDSSLHIKRLYSRYYLKNLILRGNVLYAQNFDSLLVFRVYDQSVKKLHAYSLPYDFDFLYYYSTDTLLGIALSQPGVFLLNLTGKKLTFKVLQGTGIYNFSSLCKYGTDLIGASGNGIYRIDFKGHVRQLSRELNQVFYKQAIWKIKSSGGKLWFLSDYTIASYDTVTGQIEVYPLVTYVNRYNGGFTLIGDTMIISNYYNVILAKIADLKRFFSHVKEHPDISYVQVGDLRIYGVSPNSLFFKVNDTTWNLDFKIPYNSSITVKVGLISPVYNQLIFEYKINKGHWERFNPQTPLIISQLPFGNNYLHIRIHSFVTGKNYKILVHLRVRLPFYLRPLAFVFYGIILVIIMLIISYLRSNKFKRQRDIFRKLIERKTHELVHKNKLLQEQYKQLNEMTELLKMQKEELEVQNERLRLTNLELKQLSLVAQKTNNSVLILDEKGKVEWWNTGFAKLFKFKFNLGDSSVTELVKNIRPDVYQRIQNFPKDKPFITYTTREIISELGKELWYTTTITPVYDEQGRLFRFVVLDVDITELKMAEKQIKNQRDKLKHQTEILKRINEELVESKRSLELQNKEILSSLWYAKRIQNALLPYDLFKELFPNSFIFSRAKEIVSGDFFYVTIKGDFVILAIADGTGHGVPGAFMSVLGITLLKDAIERYQNNPMPHFILNTLRDFIIKALNQNFQDVSIKDGLDIALSVVEPMEKKVYFAGANIPLNIVRNNEVLIELRGDRMPIGLYDLANVSFTLHSLNIRSGDKLYLYTDGYVDQFGGPNNKRYKRSKFRKLMIEISSLSMEEQKQKLEDELDRWMHNNDQVDDILVIGLELDLDYLITKVQFHEE